MFFLTLFYVTFFGELFYAALSGTRDLFLLYGSNTSGKQASLPLLAGVTKEFRKQSCTIDSTTGSQSGKLLQRSRDAKTDRDSPDEHGMHLKGQSSRRAWETDLAPSSRGLGREESL